MNDCALKRRIGMFGKTCLRISLLAACFALSANAGDAVSKNPSGNLLACPGFEMDRNALPFFFKRYEAGYSIDENEKHTGSRSMRLETGKQNKAQGVTCIIPGSEIKAPGQIIISGWSKAQDVTGTRDGDYAIYADVNFSDGTSLHGEAARFKPGTHDWECSSIVVKIPKPVKDVQIYAFLRGRHKGTAWFDDLFAGNCSDGMAPYSGDSFKYAAPKRAMDLTARLEKLKERAKELSDKIAQAERAGKDASMQRISLVVAELFSTYILSDAELDMNTCRLLKFTDLAILGQDELQKRIDSLPEIEMNECERIVENAIAELKSPDSLPSSGYFRKDVFFKENAQVEVQNGSFTLDGKPTFFYGIYGATPQFFGSTLKALNVNLAGTVHIASQPREGWKFEKRRATPPYYEAARKNGLFVSPLVYPIGMPKWLTDATPGALVDKYWYRPAFAFDIDNPAAKQYVSAVAKFAASQTKEFPNQFCYHIMGEEHCRPDFRGPATEKRYAEWLRTRFAGDLSQLNQAWSKSFKDFEEAARASDPQSKGMRLCWHLFNQWRLTQLNQWIIDAIKEGDTSPRSRFYTCYPCVGCLIGNAAGGWHSKMGVNIEDVTSQSSAPGWDGGFFPYEAAESDRYWPVERKKYNLAWRDETSYYDFAKSTLPDRPVFDPEWHMVTSVRHQSPLGISADYIRLGLWMEHLHGMNVQLVWWWAREAQGEARGVEFFGSLLTQPQLLEGWARAMLDLQRLAEYVALFPAQERKVRILYSEASAILDGSAHSNVLRDAYEALYFQDYPAGFITEKMIAAGKLKDCSLLVIPNAKHVSDATAEKVRQFIKNGGKAAVIGKGSFKCDEYGRERNADFMEGATQIAGSDVLDWSRQFDSLIASAGVERPVRALGPDGNPVEGLEMRAVRKGGSLIVYLLNLKHSPVELNLRRKSGQLSEVRDLIGNRNMDLSKAIAIPPRGVILMEVKNYE